MEFFIAWYGGNEYERFVFKNRAQRPVLPGPTGSMISCNVLSPQVFWFKRFRTSIPVDVRRVDPHQHRHVVRALRHHRDVAPPRLPAVARGASSARRWSTSSPTPGTLGLFFTAFLLFIRWIPMIAIAEVKGVLPEADPHHEHGEHDARHGAPGHVHASWPPRRPSNGHERNASAKRRRSSSPSSTRRASASTPPRSSRDAGYTEFDTHTPFPVHGMDAAMGLRRREARLDRLPDRARPGTTLAFAMMYWMNGIDYPLIIGGKPASSRPSRRWCRSCSS